MTAFTLDNAKRYGARNIAFTKRGNNYRIKVNNGDGTVTEVKAEDMRMAVFTATMLARIGETCTHIKEGSNP